MNRQSKRRNLRYSVALVGDGFSESIYFTDFRDTERPEGLKIIPDFPGRIGSYSGVLDRAISLKQDYDRVYAMVDMDAVISQQQVQQYLRHKRVAEREGVIILENNPCFEIWLLLHFQQTGRLFQNCEQVITLLRRYIPQYNKGLKYLEKLRLYATLRDRLSLAIENAARLEHERDDHNPLYPRAEIFKFFQWYAGR